MHKQYETKTTLNLFLANLSSDMITLELSVYMGLYYHLGFVNFNVFNWNFMYSSYLWYWQIYVLWNCRV